MNRIIPACIILVSVVTISSAPVSGKIGGMNFYKQGDLQYITHPDLFSKRSCRGVNDKDVVDATIPDDLPPREPVIEWCAEPKYLTWNPLPPKSIFFDYDKSLLKPEGKAAIQRFVEFLKDHPNARILLEGNCDERGTPEYNLALGERRAQAIMKYMVEMGIDASSITIKSYGEERPVSLGHNESSWWQNRRGDMFFSRD